MTQWWPLAGLRLTTPRLELRVPTESDLDALASLAAAGVHNPGLQPFAVPWTDVSPPERARSVLQYHWSRRAAWQPDQWSLELTALPDGAVVGTQGMAAEDFAVLREVSTGSWRGLPATDVRLRLDRQTWAEISAVPVTIYGLGPCLPMFGLTGGPRHVPGASPEEK